jgi:hypothetical protein
LTHGLQALLAPTFLLEGIRKDRVKHTLAEPANLHRRKNGSENVN